MRNPPFIFGFVFLLFFQSLPAQVFSQDRLPKFKRLSTEQGLSQGHVSAILKDKKGFMWFATDEGLNKYDGYRFSIYKHNPEKASSIGSNFVFDVLEDKNGKLWVATAGGLDLLDREKDSFTHYKPCSPAGITRNLFQDSKGRLWLSTTEGLYLFNGSNGTFTAYHHNAGANSLSNDFVYRVTEDGNGLLWIATMDGLNSLDLQTGHFTSYKNEPKNKKSISGSWIKTVYKDARGNIWAGTQGNGIAVFNAVDQSFTNYLHSEKDSQSISYNDILSFAEDNRGRLWVGTENGGINVLDPATNKFTCYRNDINDFTSLSNNSVYSLYKDDIGNLWAGTWSGGVNFLAKQGDKFRHFRQIPGRENSLSNNIILTIAGDGNRIIWMGTDGGGLNRFDRKTQTFTHYRHDPNNKNSISSDYILSIIEVEPGLLALGYQRGGFDLLNTITGVFTHHQVKNDNPNSLAELTVNEIFSDKEGILWLGTWGGGMDRYDRKEKKFTHYQNDPADSSSISNNFIHVIHEDRDGYLWVATDAGPDLFDKKNNRFVHYRNDPAQKQSLSNNSIESITADRAGNIWIGTGEGMNLFNRVTQTFKSYTEKDGFSSNMIHGMLEDNDGNIWVSSNQGLTRFNPRTNAVRNYSASDGLQGNEFKSRCAYKAPDGELFFGGQNGFNSFYPDSIKDNDFIPPVYITRFLVFNTEIIADSDINNPLKKAISETREITLTYKQSDFTFEFSALNYTLPEKNQYAYKLEGFDKKWNLVGNKRSATYTNLDAGEYLFHVIGSNNDGLWNKQGVTLKLIITPPIWLTWWFKSLVLMAIVALAFAFYMFRINIIKRQKLELQRQVYRQTEELVLVNNEEKKSRQDAELANEAKSIFLATMSHEIRTPMNGMIGMSSLLAETPLTDQQREYTKTIISCGESLLKVINDILDFSKIESGNMELEKEEFDLRNCIEDVFDIFGTAAAQTGLDLLYRIDSDVPLQIVGDNLRLCQVITNLVSNAMKFTTKGEVFIAVHLLGSFPDGQLKLGFEVRDTGIGIPADKLDRLFKAFSQVDSSTTRKYGGTGLGLVISKKLVTLMGGSIRAQSQPGEGSTFLFTIKTWAGRKFPLTTCTSHNMSDQEGKRILVVDDNPTNRIILESQLEQWKLKPVLANSAKEALDILANDPAYDLVLTDMQMPVMDGLQLTRQIREKYPVIPVILLSSVGEENNKYNQQIFHSILTKPVRQLALGKHIISALQRLEKYVAEKKTTKGKLRANFSVMHPLNILIAEDNPVNQQVILHILNTMGYMPDLVENGQEAVNACGDKSYDLILMDMQMPEMDGLEATKVIRKIIEKQPVIIALTANTMKGDEELCRNAGMDDYLGKPVRLEELVEKLEKWALYKMAG